QSKPPYDKRSFYISKVGFPTLISCPVFGVHYISAIPGIGNLQLASVKVAPFVQVGYENIGLSLNLPSGINYNLYAGPTSLDLTFQDSGVWVGSVGLEARFLSTLFLAIEADANARKNINVFTGEDVSWVTPAPYSWAGSQLQWWDVDGMVGYTFCRNWSALVGVRYDHLTVGLENPVDAQGMPQNSSPYLSVTGDVIVKTWIPYIGLQFNERNYKASLIYSPLASTQVINPQTLIKDRSISYKQNTIEWDFAKTGSFLEGYFEYDVPVLKDWQIGLWAKGTWMKFIGPGSWRTSDNSSDDSPRFISMDTTTGTLNTQSLGGGVAATLTF
ncbi:MAG: hypothetical protein M1511_19845, partial [Deltaproteobacteria bacterium]|nr:hypothetical protein [Deltaproteobacteria bacterium]